MSKREPVYAVRTSDGICGAIYRSRFEAESARKTATAFGIDAVVVELVELISGTCEHCDFWRHDGKIGRQGCIIGGLRSSGTMPPNCADWEPRR